LDPTVRADIRSDTNASLGRDTARAQRRRRFALTARLSAAIVGLLVAAFTYHVGTTTPQFADFITGQAYMEIHGWATDTMVFETGFGPATGSRCGIYNLTHHPMFASYVAALVQRLGGSPHKAIVLGVVLATALLLLQLAWRTPWGSLMVSAGITTALVYAPGYASWLQHPVGHTWAVGAFYLLASAAMLRRPVLPLAIASFIAGWISIDAAFVFAAMVAATLFAVHGVSRTTWLAALAAIAGFVLANVLHLIQVWCRFEWQWAQVMGDYFLTEGQDTSLTFRVGNGTLAQRWHATAHWIPAYVREAVVNEHALWSYFPFWAISLLLLALQPSTAWGRVGVLALLGGMASTGFFAPGLMPMHLHYLARYVLLVPIGMLIVMAASVPPLPWRAAAAARLPDRSHPAERDTA
jgi:hypothetical protein